jgi:hypothetical protein
VVLFINKKRPIVWEPYFVKFCGFISCLGNFSRCRRGRGRGLMGIRHRNLGSFSLCTYHLRMETTNTIAFYENNSNGNNKDIKYYDNNSNGNNKHSKYDDNN